MKNVGYYNGKIDLIENIVLPLNDRSVYFGDCVYDATYAANKIIFEADEHIERFFNSLKLLKIPFEMTREELKEASCFAGSPAEVGRLADTLLYVEKE